MEETVNGYISLDISTSNIGIAIFDSNAKLLDLRHLKLKNNKKLDEFDRLIDKTIEFKNYLLGLTSYLKALSIDITEIFVEEPLLMSQNQMTVIKLQKFNGMCSYVLYDVFKKIPKFISVDESRRIFCPELLHTKKTKGKIVHVIKFPEKYVDNKKQYIWEKVNKMESEVTWIYDKSNKIKADSYDMSDAYCVGIAALVKYGIKKNG